MKFYKSALATAVITALVSGQVAAEDAAENEAQEEAVIESATTANRAGNTDDDSNKVVVTGIRGGIMRAQEHKRAASSVIESVTLLDLGKFPDENIADAMQRIAGVQIERNDSGVKGDRASIRGLGPNFVTVTVNGRSPLSIGNEGIEQQRSFNLDVLPAEIISGVTVYKSPTAELIETGLAGSVEMETLKPLEQAFTENNAFGVFNLRSVNNSDADGSDIRYSGLFGWKNDSNTFGAYIGGTKSDIEFHIDEAFVRTARPPISVDNNGDGVADETLTGLLSSNLMTFSPNDGERQRESITTGFQWRPTDSLEITGDYLTSTFDVLSTRNIFEHFTNASITGVVPASAITVGNGQVETIDVSQTPNSIATIFAYDLLFNNFTDTDMGGLNLKWQQDKFAVSADLSFSSLDFFQDLNSGSINALGLTQSELFFDATSRVPTLVAGAGEALDVGNYASIGAFVRDFSSEQDNLAFKTDFEYYVNDHLTFKAGFRYSDTEVDFRAASNFIGPTPAQATAILAGTTGQQPNFLGGLMNGDPNQVDTWLLTPYQVSIDAMPIIEQGADRAFFGGGFFSAFEGGGQAGSFNKLFGDSFAVYEETYASYAQLDFNGDFGDIPFSGNMGVRVVRTLNEGKGFSAVRTVTLNPDLTTNDSTEQVPTTSRTDYTNVLPSVNLSLELQDDLQLRLSAATTMSRPEYKALAPRGAVDICQAGTTCSTGGNFNATYGNPNLQPYTAVNIDVTLEYYTDDDGAYYLSVFRKDVNNFIASSGQEGVTLPGQGGLLFDTTQPVNISDGDVDGIEIGFNQPFSFLDGFGIQANYTYVESSFDNDDAVGGSGVGFPGSSENSYNIIGYYENNGFEARVAYSYRDDYLQNLEGGFDRNARSSFTKAQEQLNASISYDITENFEVSVSGSNLTDEHQENYTDSKGIFKDYITRGRTITLGLRASF